MVIDCDVCVVVRHVQELDKLHDITQLKCYIGAQDTLKLYVRSHHVLDKIFHLPIQTSFPTTCSF